MPPADRTSSVRWCSWSADAFARARAEGKPLLLWLSAAWSRGCDEMARTTYAHPVVAAELQRRVIPVKVDADERPDLCERYSLGGIPTTAFLAPDGALIGGGTFVSPDRLIEALDRVAALPTPMVSRDPHSASPGEAPHDELVFRRVVETLDPVHGGFGGAPKFPHPAAVHLLIEAGPADGFLREDAVRTLDAIGWGELFDPGDGGFFEYCAGRDWTLPHPVKLLATNAALLDLYVHASSAFDEPRWRDRVRDVVRFLRQEMRRHDGAYRSFAGAAASRVFTAANAQAVSALLHASQLLGDDEGARQALEDLEHVLLAAYRPGEGLARCAGGVRGLLADHVAMAAALLDAWTATGELPYRMMAEELMRHAGRTLWDEGAGGFFDAPAGVADEVPAGVRMKPFVLNCDAARCLARLASACADPSRTDQARRTLASVAPQAAAQGPDAAHYLRARRACGL